MSVSRGPRSPCEVTADPLPHTEIGRLVAAGPCASLEGTMPILVAELDDHVIRFTVQGELGYDQFVTAYSKIQTLIVQLGRVRLLCVLDGFSGFERSDRWGELGPLGVERIAVVGDPRWKDEVLAFAGAGFRSAPVRYFLPADAVPALDWLRGASPGRGQLPT